MSKENVVGKIELKDCPFKWWNERVEPVNSTKNVVESKSWFTTDKPLPDGKYLWRLEKGFEPRIYKFISGKLLDFFGKEVGVSVSIGEWFKIEFPK